VDHELVEVVVICFVLGQGKVRCMEGGVRMRRIQICWYKERLWKLVMRRSVIT